MRYRILASLAGAVLAIACLSACTSAAQPIENRPFAPPVTTKSQSTPSVIDNTAVFAVGSVDTTEFSQRPGYQWAVLLKPAYAVVTVQLLEEDWLKFADQLGIDPEVDPERVQMGFETASSLVDYEAIVQDVHRYFSERGQDVDLTTLEVFYGVHVFGR